MSEPFLGEIRIVGFNFAPKYWAFCAGQLMPIQQNTALFSLLGTTFGGDGRVTFGLPDYRGRAPVGMGQGPGLTQVAQGEMAGNENVTILQTQMPAHNHMVNASTTAGDQAEPTNGVLAMSNLASDGAAVNSYLSGGTSNTTLSPTALGVSGGSQPLPIRNPYLGSNFIIALQGIFPSRP